MSYSLQCAIVCISFIRVKRNLISLASFLSAIIWWVRTIDYGIIKQIMMSKLWGLVSDSLFFVRMWAKLLRALLITPFLLATVAFGAPYHNRHASNRLLLARKKIWLLLGTDDKTHTTINIICKALLDLSAIAVFRLSTYAFKQSVQSDSISFTGES